MLRYLLLLIASLSISWTLPAQFRIEGSVQADSTWEPIVYLSLIPSLEDMYTISSDMIAMQAEVNADGKFVLQADYVPEGDRFYRLHMSKKGDPPSTIMLGGKDQNHCFLIGNANFSCSLSVESDSLIWGNLKLSSCYVNPGLLQIEKILAEYESNASGDFSLGREFLQIARDEKLRRLADSSQNLLLSLYALSQTHIKAHLKEDPAYYKSFFEKWEKSSSPYLEEFRQEYSWDFVGTEKTDSFYFYFFFGLLFGIPIWPIIQFLKKSQQENPSLRLNELSIQERKIFSMIQEGKSNKEISEVLHIEPSTVKSHVRNLYGKLQISSRKEALNFPTTK